MADDTSTTGSNSISSFGVTFVINFAILVGFITAFLLLRPYQKRIYQPRSTIDTIRPELRPRPLDAGVISWLKDLVTRREAEILQDAGLDGYFFLRFLRLIFLISVIGILFLFPILLPVNATASGDQTGFNMLSFTNTVRFPSRYYAHVLMCWVFYGFILFTLYRELVYYVSVRQAVLTSPAYTNNISSRTILISTVPREFLSEDALRELFHGIKNVWINRSQSELMKKVEERDSLALKVEGAETALLKKAIKNRLKAKTPIEGSDIDQYVPRKNRPTHRLKFLIGKKVDTIEYGREQLPILNKEIEELKAKVSEASPLNSVFVSFHTQEQAETALQTLAHHQALHMAPRHIGIHPDDIFWLNLRLFWWERLVRATGAIAAITALVIFWSIPVAFVGSISNIEALTDKLHFLRFLNNLPEWISGVVSGFLPTILLAVLMALLPIFLRLMAKVSGVPSGTRVEYYVQNAYFAFLVVQVFLVTTLSSGAAAVIQDIINEPTSAMSLLAGNIPKASNFYISYFLLQGFTIAGGALLQIVALILFHVLSTLLDNTPRKIWNRWNLLSSTGWGTVFPIYTNLAVIAITYSIISPMILCFSGLAFGVVYIAYLHNLLFVVQPSDGRGIYYPRAIFQTFTGLYIGQVCLLGLFVVAKAWGPVALQAIFLGFTIFVHQNLQTAFKPLLMSLPLNLLRKNSPQKAEEVPLLETGYQLEEIDTKHKHSNSLSSGADLEDVGATNSQSNLGIEETTKKPHVLPININLKRPVEQMSFATQYFKPHIYLEPSVVQHDFLTVRFQEPAPKLSEHDEVLAYANPAERADNPVIWIPRDPWGLADEELRKLQEQGLNAHTRGTWFDIDAEKKKFDIKYGTIDEVPIWAPPPSY
ncbi:hypothetical protein DV495_003935 [Geotrichum candidum]|nr:hypothetical protein DV495_003935 [Geotrichum candidum]